MSVRWWLLFVLAVAAVASAAEVTLQPAGPNALLRTENGWTQPCLVLDLGMGGMQMVCTPPGPPAPHMRSVEPVDPEDEDSGSDDGEGDE